MASEPVSPPPAAPLTMPASASRTATLLSNLTNVSSRITAASSTFSRSPSLPPVRLVAVSKLKPASDILTLHTSSTQSHFGENYLQELLSKSRELPPTIHWHFIGGLQSNKCVTLARDVRALWAVESVDTRKKASLLDRGWRERTDREGVEERLRVFVQVNTSGEGNKAGVEMRDAVELCRFVTEECGALRLQGLMTIGAIARSTATKEGEENEDFVRLRETRETVVRELGLEELELSMGMSSDFEGAIALGSDQVRVGTTIFGERPSKAELKTVVA